MVLDLKTYFVINRSPKAAYLDNSLINVANSPGTIAGSNQNISKVGSPDLPFTARMKDDLRHIDSSEIEYEVDRIEQHEKSKLTGNLSKFGLKFRSQNSLLRGGADSGSLKMKLLGGYHQVPETKKSVSLAQLSSSNQTRPMPSKDVPKRITFSKNAGLSSSSGVIPEIMSESQTTTGGVDYGNGNGFNLTPAKDLSAGGGGEYVSDRNLSTTFVDNLTPTSIGNNAMSPSKVDFTAHATSITRFDTAHNDFDQRLVNSIQNSSMSTEGYWSHENEALNPWTLMFRDRNVEKDYRQHFSNDYGQLDRDDMKIDEKWRVTTPKYSVFFDVLVAGAIYVIIVGVAFGVFGFVSYAWLTYFALSALVLIGFLTFASVNLIRKGILTPPLTNWTWRHVAGLLFIDLPLGAAYANMFCVKKFWSSADAGDGDVRPDTINTSHQLVVVYILFVVMIAHCNFSQLVCWTKSFVALLIGVTVVVLANCCLCVCDSQAATLLSRAYVIGVHRPPLVPYTTTTNETSSDFLINNFNIESMYTWTADDGVSDADAAASTNSTTKYVYNLTRKFFFHPAMFYGVPIYRYEIVLDVLLAVLLIVFLNYQFESNFRMSFFGDKKAYRTIIEMSGMKEQAEWLLFNIIPHHIHDSLSKYSKYSENHEMVAVVFASIINWHEMYEENFEGGREFLRVLNELVADFDELLDQSEFVQVEKIKTIGTTYMAAAGLNTGRRRLSMHPYSHLYELMEFALALQNSLENFNKDLLNFDFKMKIGYNIGPVTAGVIGSTKLYYDIWGDTVNIASRMYSNGVCGRIQVSEKAKTMLQDVYEFEYRDHIEVKGIDGGMEVYLVKGRRENMQPRSRTGTASTPS